MGDAQFDGGGSVKWEVTNSDGESGGGNKNKCKGKDKDPKGPNGKFVIMVTGRPTVIVPADGTTVRVTWGDEAEAAATVQSNPKKATAKKTS
jgi:hypothetical protein